VTHSRVTIFVTTLYSCDVMYARGIVVRVNLFDYGSLDAYIRVAEDVEAQLNKLSALSEPGQSSDRRPKGFVVSNINDRFFGTGVRSLGQAPEASNVSKCKVPDNQQKCRSCGGVT
jgi:hypothetical protein